MQKRPLSRKAREEAMFERRKQRKRILSLTLFDDIFFCILTFLNFQDMKRLKRVSSSWNKTISDKLCFLLENHKGISMTGDWPIQVVYELHEWYIKNNISLRWIEMLQVNTSYQWSLVFYHSNKLEWIHIEKSIIDINLVKEYELLHQQTKCYDINRKFEELESKISLDYCKHLDIKYCSSYLSLIHVDAPLTELEELNINCNSGNFFFNSLKTPSVRDLKIESNGEIDTQFLISIHHLEDASFNGCSPDSLYKLPQSLTSLNISTPIGFQNCNLLNFKGFGSLKRLNMERNTSIDNITSLIKLLKENKNLEWLNINSSFIQEPTHMLKELFFTFRLLHHLICSTGDFIRIDSINTDTNRIAEVWYEHDNKLPLNKRFEITHINHNITTLKFREISNDNRKSPIKSSLLKIY